MLQVELRDGSLLASTHPDGVVLARTSTGRLWKLEGGTPSVLDASGAVVDFTFSRDGRWLAVESRKGALRLYDAHTWELRADLVGFADIRTFRFSPGGDRLAIATRTSVQLIDVAHVLQGGSPMERTAGMPWNKLDNSVTSLAFSGDRKWLAMTDETGAIWFYSFDRGTWVCEVVSRGQIVAGNFSGDTRHFVATDPSGRVLLIDMATVVKRTAS